MAFTPACPTVPNPAMNTTKNSLPKISSARIFILDHFFVKSEACVRLPLSTEVTNPAAQALKEREGWTRQTDFYVYNLPLGQR